VTSAPARLDEAKWWSIPVKRASEYVRFTRYASWDNGIRQTVPVYVNRKQVTHVTGGRHVTVHVIGESSIEVTESLSEVMDRLGA